MNVSGQWWGQFSYPRHEGPTTSFLARLEDHGGRLSGTIIEPNIITPDSTIEAFLTGIRHGTSVDFVKTYGPPAPYGYEHPVDYVGSLSDDGNTIKGVWSLLEFDGTFEMHREAEAGEDIEDEVEADWREPVPTSAK